VNRVDSCLLAAGGAVHVLAAIGIAFMTSITLYWASEGQFYLFELLGS
jgi:hypothetical protein